MYIGESGSMQHERVVAYCVLQVNARMSSHEGIDDLRLLTVNGQEQSIGSILCRQMITSHRATEV